MPQTEKSGGSWSGRRILGITTGILIGISVIAVTAWAVVTYVVKTEDNKLYDVQLSWMNRVTVFDGESSSWKTVCSSSANDKVLHLVCSQLGFNRGLTWDVTEADRGSQSFCVKENLLSSVTVIQSALYPCGCVSKRILTLKCQECGQRQLSADRIVGGERSGQGRWPWQVSLRFEGEHICGGSILTPTWLITAAHCFPNRNRYLSKWSVFSGEVSQSGPGIVSSLDLIVFHGRYLPFTNPHNSDNSNDIALVRLHTPLDFTETVQSVCLPAIGQTIPDGTMCTVTGWGHTRYYGHQSDSLQEARVPVLSNSLCNQPDYYNQEITPSMFCAGYSQGEIDACQGDSGGPLVCEDAIANVTLWRLGGLVSWGTGCALAKKPGVYTRVTHYLPWIHTVMQDFSAANGIYQKI